MRMASRSEAELSERIRSRIEELGLTEAGAAKAAGLGASAIRNIREGKSLSPRLDTVVKLAAILQVTPEYLAFGVNDDDLSLAQQETAAREPTLLPVLGEVAAGRWLEIDEFVDEPAYQPVSVSPDQRWPVEAQYGLVVRGESINRFAHEGDILLCVSAVPARYLPRDGDLVIVELRRNAGMLRQRTAKRYFRTDTHIELWPDSDHPRWKKPIIIPKGLTPLEFSLEEEGGGIEAEIVAFVVSAVRQVHRWQRPRATVDDEADAR